MYAVSVFEGKLPFYASETSKPLPVGKVWEVNDDRVLRYEEGGTISFAIIVDGKRYAGWKQEDVPETLQTAERFGLGYINVNDPYPALLRTTLTPQERVANDGSFKNWAHYTVTITDDGVDFVLTKVIDYTTPTKPSSAVK